MDYLYEAKKILSGCLFVPIEKIDDDATINAAHEIDSLNFALIVVEIEDFIQAEVDPMDLLEMRTVRDLAGILERGAR
ncbi:MULTISPECIES: acyl carrier protein [Pseudomonas]|jgi:acyl carrier protein|uniref:Acyl carrier protein n=1 Tax=Pseudomonas citronellolis TaxID=53408 RepID=A0AAW6P302_9PSED|nr:MULTISPECIES: acyl carrier protein [Pseudomonas]KSW22717.1 phosphopantetheine attachment site [Pseudomonas sp. ADP]MBB1605662.1 phosphopantetheine attachment site [Pseudomonas sp. UMC76]MBB1639731.1 phosphopantetheine attachment site [Pseudomonas sp. UME83]MDF3840897.1 acyl carrier protein [Pseudomonas citronellolis]NTX89680.1 acyl carrier protein [Pseudomonas sp. UMA643]